MPDYEDVYRRACAMPEAFWMEAAEEAFWHKSPRTAHSPDCGVAGTWFSDGTTNICEAALDQHVRAGRGDHPALIFESAYEPSNVSLTYLQLRDRVACFAGALRALGVGAGDRVVIYMPMIPDAIVAMLACARIGAPHSVVFGGFAAPELAQRIDDCRPKALIAASCGLEPGRVVPYGPVVNEACAMANHPPDVMIMKQREICTAPSEGAGHYDFDLMVDQAEPADPVSVSSAHPLYILYTSGTTGEPKGLVRDTGGYATALTWSMRHVYGADACTVFWAASDIGWVVGHSYIVYGPLLMGATTVLYEGKPVATPDAGAFWRIVERHSVNILFTAATALRAIRRDDPDGTFIRHSDLSTLDHLFLAGERADPETVSWAEKQLGIPVVDHWWQTELGWPAIASFAGMDNLRTKYGSAGRAVPGYVFEIVDDEGRAVADGTEGALLLRRPLPPGCATTLWSADDRFRRVYLADYPGKFVTGDSAIRDDEGFIQIMGRMDDVINVAGHRLSTGAIEQVVSEDPDVAECAVVGIADKLKGQVPIALIVRKTGHGADPATIEERVTAQVRTRIGPVVAFRRIILVDRLPKTRSGKILRRTVRAIAERRPYQIPPTIEDPAVVDEICEAIERHLISAS